VRERAVPDDREVDHPDAQAPPSARVASASPGWMFSGSRNSALVTPRPSPRDAWRAISTEPTAMLLYLLPLPAAAVARNIRTAQAVRSARGVGLNYAPKLREGLSTSRLVRIAISIHCDPAGDDHSVHHQPRTARRSRLSALVSRSLNK